MNNTSKKQVGYTALTIITHMTFMLCVNRFVAHDYYVLGELVMYPLIIAFGAITLNIRADGLRRAFLLLAFIVATALLTFTVLFAIDLLTQHDITTQL